MLDATQQICVFLDRPTSCLHGSRGCLGSCTKPTPIIAVDEPSKGLRIQGRTVKKPSLSEDFWSTSTYEMDNSGIQSQRSISSISTSAQTVDPHGGAGSTSNPTEFVNHGLLLWNQTRQQWVGNRKPQTRSQLVREPRLSWNATYDNLLGTNKPFPHPIPLSVRTRLLMVICIGKGLENALMQASENLSRLLENWNPARLLGRMKEDDKCYKLKFVVPGLSKEDLKIIVEGRFLVINGEHKDEEETSDEEDGWYLRSAGYYNTSILLPDDAKVEEIKAELKDGILNITIPRSEVEKNEVKEVEIQ